MTKPQSVQILLNIQQSVYPIYYNVCVPFGYELGFNANDRTMTRGSNDN